MSDAEEESVPEKECKEDGSPSEKSAENDESKASSPSARDAEPDNASDCADKVSEGSGNKPEEEENAESAAEEDVKSADDCHEPMEVENISPCPSPGVHAIDTVAKDSPAEGISMEVEEEGTKSEGEKRGDVSDVEERDDEAAQESPEGDSEKSKATAASADEAEDDVREENAEQSEKDVSESEDEKTKVGTKESDEEDEASSASADKELDAVADESPSKETVVVEVEDESKDSEKEEEAKDDEETENLDRPKDGEEEGDESDRKAEDAEDEELEATSPIIVRVISTEGDEDDEEASGNIEISEVKSIVETKDSLEGSENEESRSSREESKKASGKREKDPKGDKKAATEEKKGKKSSVKTKKGKERRKTDSAKKMDVQEAAAKEDGEEDAEECAMPTLAIMDVRTVTEEDSPLSTKKEAEDGETAKEGRGSEASDEDNSQVKGAKEVSDKSESSEKQSGIEAIANKLTKKSKQTTDDNEMKNYAADTMNELLGLFGYEKVDETVKDAIQLSNNLAGPSAKDDKKGDEEKPKEGSENAVVDNDKKSVPEIVDVDKEKQEKDEKNAEKSKEKSGTEGKAASKTPQKRECSFCNKTKPCKYQVLMLGTTKFLCDDNCFREFRTKQHIVTAPAIRDIIAQNRPITRSLMNPKDHCNVCHKEIKNGMGLLPGVGENKPLCSEECMKNYQATQGLKRACAQCGNHIQSRSKCLTWEAMEFCNEECLGKYQSYLGSHCAYCNNAVQQTSLGKYCVRFGSDIKQFCSNGCLEEFKKGLKVCSYCQKDISSGTEGFLAPVGDKGQFKEFCSQSCMEKYETMGSVTPSQPSIEQCSVCNKVTSVKVEVTFENKIHKLCSEPCIAAFRYANKINTSICDTCHKFFDLDVTCQLTIQFEGTSKRFCTKACMNVFVLYHRKVVPCSWCKVKKYNFDMIERVDSNNHVQLFCSLNCLSLFRVSLNATSSKRIQCDFCHQVKPAQYHLTMSDASIRNFCSYNCVMQFQGQFTNVAPVVAAAAAPTPQVTATRVAATATTTSAQSGTPVISSVMSLAPSQPTPQPQTQITKAISIRPMVTPVVTKIHKVMGTQTMAPTITQQVIIKQAPVKPQKNKMLMCRPMTQTKGVSCKPHPCHKSSQTDGEYREHPVFIPIPVPVYVPVPMRMYSTPVPFPVAFPLPIPIPIFIPTTKDSAQGIFKQIKEIQQKIPNNPFEADLILMAEMVAEDSSAAKGKTKALMGKLSTKGLDGEQSSSNDASSEKQEGFVVETSIPDSCQPANTFGDEVLQMALRMASSMEQPGDLENVLSNQSPDLNSTGEENGSYMSARELRGQARNNKRSSSRPRGRGRKRARMDDALEREPDSPSPVAPTPHTPPVATQFDFRPIGAPQLESNCVLKFSYGVNAWKHWVLQKNTQLEKASQSNRKLKLFKTDILQLSADELNYSLCLFIKEVRKPNGDEYAPDSIYYLCLGIQQYLFENGRIDNIFSDAYYEKFTECLNEVLQRYEATLASDGCFLSRIEEEILWECKQLGAHSPHVLLNTLMYFNTKFFMLKSIDDHLQLSFSHILKHWKKTPGSTAKGSPGGRNVLLRYYPPSQVKADSPRRRKEAIPSYEQVENLDNPLRCPVKLYEFYLSKCPESIKNRNDIFYLYPERSCVPDSPVWYSTMPLGKETIAKMLQRIRMVREVGDNITTT